MKTLPDNPNLDHLRQQAKQLLSGLKEADPAATLAQAQASLAEQYGFRTWTDLKAEVDRLRSQSDLGDPALARAIAECYGLGEVVGEMRSLARPDEMGRRWSLVTDRGRWAARTMDSWWPIVDADTDVALQEAAAAGGVRLPAPVRSRAGQVVETLGDHRWRVYAWMHAGPPLTAPAGSAVTRQVGAVLATIHGLGLPVDGISAWHASRFSADVAWPDLAASVGDASWAAALHDAVPSLVELEAIAREAPLPAPVLTHNALNPGSTRLSPDGTLVVVGWEHAGGQPPSWELANALMDWTVNPSGGVNLAGARALAEGYRAKAGELPALELGQFRGAINSLQNFVFGQVQTALDAGLDAAGGSAGLDAAGGSAGLNAAGVEERRYFDRSVHHLLAHLPTRSTLEQLLTAVAPVAR